MNEANLENTFYISKQIEFSAAHRLFLDHLSHEENVRLFGPCANPFGHGHNYTLEVTLKGKRDPKTQMVVHFGKLKHILQEYVVSVLDHRHLNHDVEFLKGVLPTSENIVEALWNRLAPLLNAEKYELFRLKFSSTARNCVEYFGP